MSKFFIFTQNNPETKPEETLAGLFEYLIYQHEKVTTDHFQGYVIMKKIYRDKAIRLLLPDCHIEIRKGTHEQAKAYVTKEESRVSGPFEFGKEPKNDQGKRSDLKVLYSDCKELTPMEIREKYPAEYIKYYSSINKIFKEIKRENEIEKFRDNFKKEDINLKDWQQEVWEQLNEQTDRQILWIVDIQGGKGKTYLSNCIQAHFSTFYSRGGKLSDIAYAYNYEEYIIFDYTRESQEFINYSVIEMFKDGKLWSPKYESQLMLFSSKKVLCLSNFYPDLTKMSEDRWVLKHL